MTEGPGFYCNMNALSKTERERHRQLILQLGAARIETQELPDGYVFRLQREKVSLADLGEWISYEARCCPFFDFEVQLQRDNGPLWLKLKGKDGIKPFIRAELGIGDSSRPPFRGEQESGSDNASPFYFLLSSKEQLAIHFTACISISAFL